MKYVVFDLETQNVFSEVNSSDPTALDISVAGIYDMNTDTYTTVVVDELSTIWPIIEQADALVGYNSNHFDLPLLNKYYPGDLSTIKSIDILESIKLSLGRRVRLDDVAKATIGSKKNADGLQAVRWWREGKIDDIKRYCQQDVKVTAKVFNYALTNGHVRVKEGYKNKEVPIDTSDWKILDKPSGLTHSLPF